MSRYRFALRPKWIISHLFIAAIVVGMVIAGLWQIDRLHQKQDRNDRVQARGTVPVTAVDDLVGPGDDFEAAQALEFRRVTATGTYLADQSVLVRSRSLDGAPGSWVITPLELDDGSAVAVNRGWIPNSGQLEAVPEAYRGPSGAVTVEGLVRPTETRGSFGPTDPSRGTLTSLARADVERLDEQVPEDLLPLYVQLQAQEPAVEAASDPRPVPAPELDEGPHLSYAVQWFLFTAIALVGYPLILRRRARELEREALDTELDGPDPTDVPGEGDPRLDPVPGRRDPLG